MTPKQLAEKIFCHSCEHNLTELCLDCLEAVLSPALEEAARQAKEADPETKVYGYSLDQIRDFIFKNLQESYFRPIAIFPIVCYKIL